jgi:glycosyltransferase involved in cell wall biosynthesis
LRPVLDATYSAGPELSGVGVYSRQLITHLADAHPYQIFTLAYRPHRLRAALFERIPRNCRRRLLTELGPLARCDIFHGLNQRLPRRSCRRSVVTFHDLFVMTGEYSTPEFRQRFSEQAAHAASRADLIIAVSEFTADQVHALLAVERARIRVIHHGVTPRPPASESRRERVILHTGAIQARKNIARLIEAFERTPSDWRLVLAGSTSGYGAGEILARIDTSPRRHDITVTGYIAQPELEALYARAAIFAFPSLDEGFGMPVLDAMSRGVPVLTSNRSALPEVAGGAAFLVDPFDTDALTAALLNLCGDADLRDDLTRRGLMRASTSSWKEAAWKTWRVYEELAG